MDLRDLATPEAFAQDPRTVWEWYDWRRGIIAAANPNRGHEILAEFSARLPGFTVLTQNVDGLHERAGTRKVIRLHGSIWELRCQGDCGRPPWEDLRALAGPAPLLPGRPGPSRPKSIWRKPQPRPSTTFPCRGICRRSWRSWGPDRPVE